MRNIKLLLEYDGTRYVGWQRQTNGRSIQGEIESVLTEVLRGEEITIIGAGRTDAGVHARGQVANFRTRSGLSVRELHGALNGLLPEDIATLSVDEVPADFHARYSAKARAYSYLITLKPAALVRNYSWYVKYSMNIDLMNRASGYVMGKHDFSSFSRTEQDSRDRQCDVSVSQWLRDTGLLRYTITANRFLHGMVRALVGTMVDVGRGYTSLEEFAAILEKKDRREAGMAAPARGLVLESVTY